MKTKTFADTILGLAGFLLVATVATPSFAQSTSPDQSAPQAASQPRGHERGEDPFAGLNLSDDQKAQIKKIHEDARAKAEAVKSDTSLSDADKGAKLKEIHHSAMEQSRAVLTPEQRAQLKAER